MKCIGYDANSGWYYFRNRDRLTWVGEEGVEVGEMTRGSSLFLEHQNSLMVNANGLQYQLCLLLLFSSQKMM